MIFGSKVIIIFIKIVAILIGSLLIGTGINGFLVPHHLLDGGIVGLALILHYHYEFQVGICMILLSTPLCIFAWFLNRNLLYTSLQGLLVSSFSIDWLAPIQTYFPLPIFISSLLGGAIIGVGIGLMLRYETSTGGTDLLAYIISRSSTINIGIMIFLLDGLVAIIGYNALGLKSFLYSALTILVVGFIASRFTVNEYRRTSFLWRGYPFL
ncbi:MAG TPA: YitT family protein [Pseudoneobacillus sp.]|nr:YitT family protein [Pseudoneobacillus sp.]